MFSQVNGAEFCSFEQKALHFYCETQRFQNAITAVRFLDFHQGKAHVPASPFPRPGNTMFSQVNQSQFGDFIAKVLRFYCET